MGEVKGFFLRQIGPFPVYVYALGLVALVGGVIYFKNKSSGIGANIVNAPQTKSPNDPNAPLPYPYPGGLGWGAPVPPAPWQPGFLPPGLVTPQSNFQSSTYAGPSGGSTGYSPYTPPPPSDGGVGSYGPPGGFNLPTGRYNPTSPSGGASGSGFGGIAPSYNPVSPTAPGHGTHSY